MTPGIGDEIGQTRPFASREQEAHIALGRTWALLDHAFNEALRPHGITTTQYNVLRILRGAGKDGLCRSEIMDRMIARVPDATRLLDRLEEAGLIGRERRPVDRRYVTTTITPAGLELLETLDDAVVELHRQHCGALNQRELATLVEYLDRMRDSLQ
jgi:DNA-binding MarR family transcriptional regulator